ncbi:peptide chain release factor N(5)-glutamine methyltransferase [Thermicanus aegyptius]|uniref:peptide chain release factor N(5)-glutamine methyltransferase n=1 Tax=Thermicanus aegyptius TaxID=94009 RepID=UPI00041A7398|nr:peptide chain release factor N(5)-glutamine methyltransferase [Thermicanus aegyptius]
MGMTARKAYEEILRNLRENQVEGAEKTAELLLSHAFGWDKTRFLLALSDPNPNVEWGRVAPLLERRKRGEPLQYILGEAPFYKYTFLVTPDVLIPRPETELLVEAALRWSEETGKVNEPLRLIDLGVGSGAISLTLLRERPRWEGWGVDRSEKALEVSRKNAERLGVAERYHPVLADMREISGKGFPPFPLLLSNPPYIPTREIPSLQKEVRDYEPRIALDGGEDGLLFYRDIFRQLPDLLLPEGVAFFEVGIHEGKETVRLLQEIPGIKSVELIKDFQGIDRIVIAYRI